MTVQGELFGKSDACAPAGLTLWPGFLNADEAEGIEALVDAAPLAPFQFGQWEGKRLTASYGSAYDFSRGRLAEAPPFPDWLRELAGRAENHAGLAQGAIAQALLIRYDPGAGIGWHRDRPQFGSVLGLSLTDEAVLRLRRRTDHGFERHAVPLPVCSLYRLEGPVRWDWEHSIVPGETTRRSITFRTMRA